MTTSKHLVNVWQTLMLLLVAVLVVYLYSAFANEVTYKESLVDKRQYRLRVGKKKSEKYKQESVDTLAEINGRVERLIEHLNFKYNGEHANGRISKILKTKYSPSILSEAANDKRYTTFTVDKKDMHICLRTRDTEERMYDINLLMYVVLHELAHLCNYDANDNPIIGHGKEFIEIFRFLVQESMLIGVYQYSDYASRPVEYCGMFLSSNIA